MTDQIKISVIIPSYNQGKYISNSIASVIAQSYSNWELIIQDGASKDETVEICIGYALQDARILFYSEPDNGFADAVNKGLNKATGEYAVIQSSDDFFSYPNVFQDVVNHINLDPQLILISGASVVVDDKLNHLKTGNKINAYIQPENVFTLKSHFSQGATFFSLERALKIGKLDPSIDMVADTDFWVRMCCYHPAKVNSVFQSSKVWCCILVQPEQRSADLSKFYLGRAEMAINHLNNSDIMYSDAFKRKHANDLIKVGFRHFEYNNISSEAFISLFNKLNEVKYKTSAITRNRTIANWVKKKLGVDDQSGFYKSPNSISEIYFDNNAESTGYNYKWFETDNAIRN